MAKEDNGHVKIVTMLKDKVFTDDELSFSLKNIISPGKVIILGGAYHRVALKVENGKSQNA